MQCVLALGLMLESLCSIHQRYARMSGYEIATLLCYSLIRCFWFWCSLIRYARNDNHDDYRATQHGHKRLCVRVP